MLIDLTLAFLAGLLILRRRKEMRNALIFALIALSACTDATWDKYAVLTIMCKVPSTTNPKGFEVVEYKTLKYRPLYRGGWDFTDVGGARVLSTQRHYDSTRGGK